MEHPATLSTQDSDHRLSHAGALDVSRPRDGASQSVFEVRHTDPLSFIDDMTKDAAKHLVLDEVVRLAINGGRATQAQVDFPEVHAGGNRDMPWFRSRYIAASYQARGQLVKLSCYAGVVYVGPADRDGLHAQTRATALKVQSTMRQVQVAIERLGLDRRGGIVYVEDPTDPWMGDWLASIADPEPVTCLHCGEEIYYSNEAFRHVSTKRAEATVDAIGRSGNKIKRIDHYAEAGDPEESEDA